METNGAAPWVPTVTPLPAAAFPRFHIPALHHFFPLLAGTKERHSLASGVRVGMIASCHFPGVDALYSIRVWPSVSLKQTGVVEQWTVRATVPGPLPKPAASHCSTILKLSERRIPVDPF